MPTVAPTFEDGLLTSTIQVAPGMTLTRMSDLEAPNRIFLLTVDVSRQDLTVDVGLPRGSELGGVAPLSEIVERNGAIAAVNGDYGVQPGRPLHLFAMDGDLYQTSLINRSGRNFALSTDEQTAYFGNPRVKITLDQPAADSGSVRAAFKISRWNDGAPGKDELAGYSDHSGGLEPVPPGMCEVRLAPTGPRTWAPGRDGIRRNYEVQAAHCGQEPLDLLPGTLAVATPVDGSQAAELAALQVGAPMRLQWSLGWPGVTDAIGGSALLVHDGEIAATECHGGYECWRHPRTGVGMNADGDLMLVVVDGRQDDYSIGLHREEFAELMRELGAVDALALDGGGSSEMVVNGVTINHPLNATHRGLMSALLIRAGPDQGEHVQPPTSAATTTPSAAPAT